MDEFHRSYFDLDFLIGIHDLSYHRKANHPLLPIAKLYLAIDIVSATAIVKLMRSEFARQMILVKS